MVAGMFKRACVAGLEPLEARRLFAAITYAVLDVDESPQSVGYDVAGPVRVNLGYIAGGYINNIFQQRGIRANNALTKAIDLPPVKGSTESTATDVTDVGVAVGISYNGLIHTATKWTNGKAASLGAGEAFAISNNGKYIVGIKALTGGSITEDRAAVFAPSAKTLGTLGGNGSHANDVNNSGYVVGQATNAIGRPMPFVYNGTKMIEINGGRENGEAYAINNSNIVVGQLEFNAFSYNAGTKKLTMLSPATAQGGIGGAVALDINSGGQIVGYTQRGGGNSATIWNGTAATDLNKLIPSKSGWQLEYAKSIDDQGQILGTGIFNGQSRAFLLKPQRGSLSSSGTLAITGSAANDIVSVSVKSSKISVVVNGVGQTFTKSKVKRISVDLASGNDTLTLSASLPAANIKGGSGNDIFNIRNNVKDIVDGGAGKDKAKLDGSDTKSAIEELLK